MEHFMAAYHTDVGIKKKTNQDSLLLKSASDGTEEVLLAVLCDGMGGMEKGELASAAVIRAFSDWFMDYCGKAGAGTPFSGIKSVWYEMLRELNQKLINYGEKSRIQLGTTVTAIFLVQRHYLICHVGDTRIYLMNHKIQQLTEDHTFVAREVRRGNMTEAQAAVDTRRNVLLQCIGVNAFLEPQFLEGNLESEDRILLCSDGFRHEISEKELSEGLGEKALSESDIKHRLYEMVELNKQRGETDNISAILIQVP